MPQTRAQRPGQFFDDFGALPNGVNSGVEVLLLPPTQAAYASNATFRGGYIFSRPPYRRQTLDFDGDEDLQEAFIKSFFQGSGTYRPDFGLTQIIVQASGRIFRLTQPNDEWLVEEITIPGDPNDPAQPRAWMWQSEKWLIINDGSGKLPLIYDGVTLRRSFGPSVELGEVSAGVPANFPNPRVIGEVIEVTLAAPYTGAFNIPVIYNGHFYQTQSNSTGSYDAILTALKVTAGAVPSGSAIVTTATNVGWVKIGGSSNAQGGGGVHRVITVEVYSTLGLVAGQQVNIPATLLGSTPGGPTAEWTITSINTSTNMVVLTSVVTYAGSSNPTTTIPNDSIINSSSSVPNTIIAHTTAAFTNPANGGTVGVSLDLPYTGAANQVVWIGNDQYSIAAQGSGPPSTTLFLRNLNDTTDGGAAVPTGDPDGLILSVPELPAGRMGAYIQQRNVMSLVDGLGFIVGDIAGGAAGTQAENYRDAVLKVTENDFLAGGGTFRVPSSGNIITAIVATANLDQAFGQGMGQIGTDTGMWGLNLPTDRTTWASLSTPLLPASLLGYGPLAQLSTILSNSDVIFRQTDGMASLKFARRDFNQDMGGNTPISREVSNVLDADEKSLLPYGSAVTHDNRLLMTSGPIITGRGVVNRGLVALNFDLVSSLRGKAPPIYDGLWTGLNLFQAVTGNFSGVQKSYAFGWHQVNDEIELFELVKTGDGLLDNDDTRIVWSVESPPMFRPDQRPKEQRLVRLLNGQLHVRDVSGLVNITVQWRPDFSPCWQDWHSLEICANVNVENGRAGYRTPIGLGEPSGATCEESNNRPYRVGRFFQVRLVITGSLKLMGAEFEAVYEPTTTFQQPLCEAVSADESELLIPAPS